MASSKPSSPSATHYDEAKASEVPQLPPLLNHTTSQGNHSSTFFVTELEEEVVREGLEEEVVREGLEASAKSEISDPWHPKVGLPSDMAADHSISPHCSHQ